MDDLERIWPERILTLHPQVKTFGEMVSHPERREYIRADLCADPALLAEAVEVLRYLLADIQDYQRINNLGGENNHSQVRARAFLAKLENRHDR